MVEMTEEEKIPGPLAFSVKLLMQSGGKLFFYMVFYLLLVISIINPMFNRGIQWAMDIAGFRYLTSENLIRFLTHPAAVIVVTGLVLLCGIFLFFAIAFIMTCQFYAEKNQKKSGVSLLSETMKRAWIIFLPRNFILIFAAILMAFFYNSTFLIMAGSRIRMPRYFIETLSKIKHSQAFFIACLVFLVLLAFSQLFLLPYCILEHKSFREGVGSNRRLLKKRWIKTIFLFLLFNILIGIFCVSLYFLGIAASAFFVKLFVQRSMAVAVFLMIYEHINFYAGALAAMVGTIVNTSLISGLYIYYKREKNEKFGRVKTPPAAIKPKKPWFRNALLVLAVLLLIVDMISVYDLVRNGTWIMDEPVQITSHRGNSALAPENTMPAMELAIEHLADYIELDLQQTRDGTVVVFHDGNLKRITGKAGTVWALDYEQLKELDAGSWFGEEYAGTPIPVFEDVLKLCKGKIKLNIELKNNSHTPGLIDDVISLVEKYNLERQCVITSARYSDLVKVKEKNKSLKTGYILAGGYGSFYYNREAADFFSIKSSFVTDRLVKNIHNLGKEVHVWTVNSKKELERMKQLEVDNIITDKPILAREVVYGEESNRSFLELLKMVY